MRFWWSEWRCNDEWLLWKFLFYVVLTNNIALNTCFWMLNDISNPNQIKIWQRNISKVVENDEIYRKNYAIVADFVLVVLKWYFCHQ